MIVSRIAFGVLLFVGTAVASDHRIDVNDCSETVSAETRIALDRSFADRDLQIEALLLDDLSGAIGFESCLAVDRLKRELGVEQPPEQYILNPSQVASIATVQIVEELLDTGRPSESFKLAQAIAEGGSTVNLSKGSTDIGYIRVDCPGERETQREGFRVRNKRNACDETAIAQTGTPEVAIYSISGRNYESNDDICKGNPSIRRARILNCECGDKVLSCQTN